MAAFKASGELAECLVLGRKCAALSFNCLFRYNVEVAGGNLAAQVDGAWHDDQFLEVTNVLGSAPALRFSLSARTVLSSGDRRNQAGFIVHRHGT